MKCIRCGRKAALELRYSGHGLCGRHFTELFERRVKKTIRQNRLLNRGDIVLVGLSGGKDSMTALKILNDIISPIPGTELSAVTVDEGICSKDIENAAKYCAKLGLEHSVLSFKDEYGLKMDDIIRRIQADGVLACSVCGVLKRRLINDYAKSVGATKVATGHNLDDEIQAAFMNIVRGDLGRMARLGYEAGVSRHSCFVPRIKILRECLDEEVSLYAKLAGLPYASKRCPYSKKSYRTTVEKLLNRLEDKHPGSKYQMLRSVDEFAAIMRSRVGSSGPVMCERCGEASSANVCKTCVILEDLGGRFRKKWV